MSVEITLVKANQPGQQHRVYMRVGDDVIRVPVHPVHDLPHLVVESAFEIDDGLWAELAAGRHAAAAAAATARNPKRQKAGRIVSGAAEGVSLSQWLTAGHRSAKVLTNAVANRFGDGADTAAGVRERVARAGDEAAKEKLSRIDDDTIAHAITDSAAMLQRWADLPAGEALRLSWPLHAPLGGGSRINP